MTAPAAPAPRYVFKTADPATVIALPVRPDGAALVVGVTTLLTGWDRYPLALVVSAARLQQAQAAAARGLRLEPTTCYLLRGGLPAPTRGGAGRPDPYEPIMRSQG